MYCVVFAGQGTQKINMFKNNHLWLNDIIKKFNYKYDLLDIVKNGPNNILNKTTNTQLLLLLQGYLLYNNKIKNKYDIKYSFGNSIGEYTSLTISNSISIYNMLNLIKERGELMENIFNQLNYNTSMLGIRSDNNTVQSFINDYDSLCIALDISPKTTVISGNNIEINEIKNKIKKINILSTIINPNYGFHNLNYMKKYENDFYNIINKYDFNNPNINIISNYNNKLLNKENIKNNLTKHLSNTVKLRENIEFTLKNNVKTYFNIGGDLLIKNSIQEISRINNYKNIIIEDIIDN